MNYSKCLTVLDNLLNDLMLDREALYVSLRNALLSQEQAEIKYDISILDAKISLIEDILRKVT